MKNKIREIRKNKSITQTELANSIGISRPYLSDIERGVANPGGDIIIKIANYLNLLVEEIFFTNHVNHDEQKENPKYKNHVI
ncbi:putative transcriptional regulator [Desulfonispora thiosulfatigenes DSM 11270]|uniref:Putative transcriptional regulator n=1 Tax=Desulfonispora thiosulfatigenes DSM 11270 TaxID=656914 RepID=A0A1W1VQC1_DESTI|nr:helix-turn-helix transcriptional regulator [Desulfonispora thiosulfatigenes]SMB95549.1 putative transcriptional regulator [Desulfonispora thiosulfatigenes DSM 11270]